MTGVRWVTASFAPRGSVSEQIQELARSHDVHTFILAESQEIRVSVHDERGPALECGGDVLVVVGIVAHPADSPLAGHEVARTTMFSNQSMNPVTAITR